tara:strand:- start:52537 stop:53235 length:699 start_codon:yes stop_codon:yes gene_type:complete
MKIGKLIKQGKIVVLVDGGFNDQYKNFLERLGPTIEIRHFKDEDTAESKSTDIDLLLFTGGADVQPVLYGEKVGRYTQINKERDKLEQRIFSKFRYIPKLGICRGSQFLTVMAGGELIQHVTGHGATHKIQMQDGGRLYNYDITSTHHQMMNPFTLASNRYQILAWSKNFLSNTYLNGDNEEVSLHPEFLESEIVYYPEIKALAIQGHPEFGHCPADGSQLCVNLIKTYILK